MQVEPDRPVVRTQAEIDLHSEEVVYVEGIYRQEDVRMRQENPSTLFLGHVVIELEDGCKVFLYPPMEEQARRNEEEIRLYEHKRVRALGLVYPDIPQPGTIQDAPCLVDIRSIEVVDIH